MQDDPFSRAVERAHAAEEAHAASTRRQRQALWSSGNRTAFRIHATVYLAVNLFLFLIWLTTWQLADGTDYPWFLWVLCGWGIGLAAHYAAVRRHLHGPAPAGPDATVEELARLAELHRSGALSTDEFAAAKARLLS